MDFGISEELIRFNFVSCVITTIGLLICVVMFATPESVYVGVMGITVRWGSHFDFKRKISKL